MFQRQAQNVDMLIQAAYERGLRDAPFKQPKAPTPVFHKNAKGQPEYGTIQIVFDHLMEDEEGHQVTKVVLDTRDPEASLRRLWDYYGETANLMSLASTLDLLLEHRLQDKGFFIYVVPAAAGDRFGGLRVEVLMGTDVFSALSQNPNFGDGSEFLLIQNLTKHVAEIMGDVRKSRGGFPPLTYIGLEGQLVMSKLQEPHEGSQVEEDRQSE